MGCVSQGAKFENGPPKDRQLDREPTMAERFAQREDNSGGGGGNQPPGGGNGGGGNGGDDNDPRYPRIHEHDGWYYDRKKERQVSERGRTTIEIAQLPYRSIWEADSIDRLREGEIAIVYFGSGKENDYVAFNEPRKEIVAMSDKTNPKFIIDDEISPRRSLFGKVMHALTRRRFHHRPSQMQRLSPARNHRVAGFRANTIEL